MEKILELKFNVILAVNDHHQWVMKVQDELQIPFETQQDIILNDTFILENELAETYLILKRMFGEDIINKLMTALYHKGFKRVHSEHRRNLQRKGSMTTLKDLMDDFPQNLIGEVIAMKNLETENLSYYGSDVQQIFQKALMFEEYNPFRVFECVMCMGADCFREHIQDALQYSVEQIFYLED